VADKKVSAFSAKTTVASTDLLHVVTPSVSNNKITVSDFRGYVDVRDYDDLEAAIDAVPTGGVVYVAGGGTITLSSVVATTKSDFTLLGDGQTTISVNGNNAISFTGSRIRVSGVNFTSSATGTSVDKALDFTTSSDITVDHCTFGRVLLEFGVSGGSIVEDVRIENNKFTGDYTNATGADTYNIIDFRGVQRFHITGNTFDVVSPYRFLKISATETTETTASNISKQGIIRGNVMFGTMAAGKQIIDTFCNTSELLVTDNIVNVSGTISHFIDAKPGADADSNPNADAITDILVSNNTVNLSGTVTSVIALQGAWGHTWEGSTHHRCIVSGNQITHGDDSTTSTIDIRGMESARVVNNTISKTAVNFARGIRCGNCQSSQITGNLVDYGIIEVLDGLTSAGGDTYTKDPLRAVITDNIIEDFVSNSGVHVDSQSGMDSVIISNNYIRNGTDSATILGPVSINASTITDLCITGNTSDMAGTNKDDPYLTGSTLTKYRDYDNSWNVLTFTFDPTNLVDGAGTTTQQTLYGADFGASVEVAAPYDLQDITVTGYVRNTNTIEVRVQNESGATVDLASGTWAVAYRRIV
jgi:hypothetical protein